MTGLARRSGNPRVVYIDDRPDESESALKRAFRQLRIVDLSKQDWESRLEEAIADADLVISDFKFEPARLAPGGHVPPDGQVMNETVRALRRANPPIVAIYSGRLDEIPCTSGMEGSPQQLARALNAAFIGEKNQPRVFVSRLRSMVGAIRSIRRLIGNRKVLTEEQFTNLLKLPRFDWRESAMRALDLSRAPIHEDNGRARLAVADVLNWFVRDVLPYPGVFIDAWNLAVMLRLEPKWFERRLHEKSDLLSQSPFRTARYHGILSDFYGVRWWTAGVDQVLWSADAHRSRESLEKLTSHWLGRKLHRLSQRTPVLEVDEFGVPTGNVIEATDAVRIMPIGWPASGPWPWISRDVVRNDPVAKALALPDDLHAAGLA